MLKFYLFIFPLNHYFYLIQQQVIHSMNVTQDSIKSKSLRAKYIAKKPEIDESLFGIKAKRPQRSVEELNKVTDLVKKKNYNHPQLAVLKDSDLERMKNTIKKPTKEQEALEKKAAEEQKQYRLALAKAKKEQMLKLQQQKKKKTPLNEFEREQLQKRKFINSNATHFSNQQLDDVKTMNKMVAYAKAATIRQRQLDEKQRMWEQYKTQQKKKDILMEIQRLKKIKQQDEIEMQKKVEALKGKEVIIDQIKSRQIDRLRLIEEQEREAQIMVHKMKELQRQEQLKNLKKKQQQKKMNEEIVKSNKNAMLIIQQRRQKEKDQEEKIAAYIKEKSEKEAELIAQQKRIKEQKQKQIQRLRELQEKASDRQAQLDALRAKRAAEANERAARKKQKEQAEIRAKKAEQLRCARIQQQLQKEKMLEEQARAEKAEFQAVIRKQKEARQLEQKLEQERKDLLKKHALQLKKQIADKGETKQQSKKVKEIQDKQQQQQFQAQKHLLEHIKQEKIKQLKSLNVPDKYIVELQNKKIH